jgi:mRNA interferase MazF
MSERAVEPLRGEVWDARIPVAASHPVVILTINPMISRLSSVTVALITGTPGPAPTHIPVDSEAGLTRDDVSYVNATDLHTLDQARLARRRGRLHPAEQRRLDAAVRRYLGL